MQINWENFHSPRISNLAVRVVSWLRWYNKNWSCDWSPDIKIYSSSLKKKTGKKGREKLAFMFWSKSFSWLNIRNIITCMKLYDFKIFRKIAKNAINGCFEGLSTFLSHWEDFWFHKWCLRCDKCHVKLFVNLSGDVIFRGVSFLRYLWCFHDMPRKKRRLISIQNFSPEKMCFLKITDFSRYLDLRICLSVDSEHRCSCSSFCNRLWWRKLS